MAVQTFTSKDRLFVLGLAVLLVVISVMTLPVPAQQEPSPITFSGTVDSVGLATS